MSQFGTPKWQVDGMMETFAMIGEGHEAVCSEELGDFKSITGQDPISLSRWI